MKRKLALILGLAVLAGLIAGGEGLSAGYRDIENMEVVQTLGIDRQGKRILITAGIGKIAEEESKCVPGSGSSLAEALYNMEYRVQEKQLYFKHTENILISKESAECDIREIIDYVARMPSLRLMTDAFVLREGKIGETMEQIAQNGGSVSEQLASLRENEQALGAGVISSCRDLYGETETNGCCVTQAVGLTEEEPYCLIPAGVALLSEYRLDGFLGEKASRGAALILNRVKTEELCLPVQGGTVDVEVQPEKLTIDLLDSEGEKPTITMRLEVSVSVTQVSLNEEIGRETVSRLASQAVEREIGEQLGAAIAETQAFGRDYLGIGKTVSKGTDGKEKDWEQDYSILAATIRCHASTVRMYDVGESPESGKGQHG